VAGRRPERVPTMRVRGGRSGRVDDALAQPPDLRLRRHHLGAQRLVVARERRGDVELARGVAHGDELAPLEDRQRRTTQQQRDSLTPGRLEQHRLGEDRRELGRHRHHLGPGLVALGPLEPAVEPLHDARDHLGLGDGVSLQLARGELAVGRELLRRCSARGRAWPGAASSRGR
jgi:hypothetical protein